MKCVQKRSSPARTRKSQMSRGLMAVDVGLFFGALVKEAKMASHTS